MPLTATQPGKDRRIEKTRLALRHAMLALLPERGWDDLNVQEICERANVGRSTFYLHYGSKEDLLAESFNGLREELRRVTAQNGKSEPLGFVSALLAHVFEYQRVSKAVIGRRSAMAVQRRFADTVLLLVEEDMTDIAESWQRQAAARYIAGGLVELMAWWLESPDEPDITALEKVFHAFARPVLAQLDAQS